MSSPGVREIGAGGSCCLSGEENLGTKDGREVSSPSCFKIAVFIFVVGSSCLEISESSTSVIVSLTGCLLVSSDFSFS